MKSTGYRRPVRRCPLAVLVASVFLIDGCDSAGEVVTAVVGGGGGIVAAVFGSTASGAAGVLPILFTALGMGYQPPNVE